METDVRYGRYTASVTIGGVWAGKSIRFTCLAHILRNGKGPGSRTKNPGEALWQPHVKSVDVKVGEIFYASKISCFHLWFKTILYINRPSDKFFKLNSRPTKFHSMDITTISKYIGSFDKAQAYLQEKLSYINYK